LLNWGTCGGVPDIDETISAASDKLLALSKQAIDPAFMSFCSFGKVTSVPRDKVTLVVTCVELVTNPSLCEHRHGTLVAPTSAFLGLDGSVGDGHEADFFDAGRHDLVSSGVKA